MVVLRLARVGWQLVASLLPHRVFIRNKCSTGPSGVNLGELSAEEQDLRRIVNPKQERD